jgi:hypothetical protein
MDRLLECEAAAETRLQDLICDAVSAGWVEVEVCTAIGTLADHHILAVLAKGDRTAKHARTKR